MALNYDVTNWYWSVQNASPGTQVWSSASGSYVALADATYVAWLASGGVATSIDTDTNLWDVISSAAFQFFNSGAGWKYSSYVSAVDLSLTNPVGNYVDVRMTAVGQYVILPQANLPTSLPLGALVSIRNNANFATGKAFGIKSSSGAILLGSLDFGEVAHIQNSSFATSAGSLIFDVLHGSGVASYISRGGTGLSSFTLGDTLYAGTSSQALSPLSGNTSATLALYTQTGDGVNSAAPVWQTVAALGLLPTALTNAHIFVGSAGNVATDVAMSGDATLANTGALTIAAGAVTLAKQANMATSSLVYRKTAGSGAPEVNTLATLKTDLGLTGTNSGDQTITLTGDVTGTGTGSFATTLAAGSASNLNSGTLPAGRLPALTGDVTTSAGSAATTLANIPSGTPMAGSELATNIAAPSTPASGKTSIYVDSTDKRLHDKNDAGTIGTTVVADTGASNNFLTAISAAGVVSKAQPSFSNISGTLSAAQSVLTGTSTNDDAASGKVGEYIEGSLSFASRTSLTSVTAKTLCSIPLPAGDWDVEAIVGVYPANTTNLRFVGGSTHTVTNTQDPTIENKATIDFGTAGSVSDANYATAVVIPRKRYSLSTTTTVYLVAFSQFSVSTAEAYGKMTARRVR